MTTDTDRMGGMTGVSKMNVAKYSRWPCRVPAILVLAALVVPGCPACPLQDPDPIADCTPTTRPPSVQPDPCEAGDVLARLRLPRETGAPNTATAEFRVPADSEICLQFISVPNEQGRVIASARASLDGVELANTSDFSQSVTGFVKRATVGAGSHELEVSVASVPGAELVVVVRAAFTSTPAHEAVLDELGRLETLACEETNESLDLIGPDALPRHLEALRNAAVVPGRLVVLLNAYGVPKYISGLPTIPLSGVTPTERAEDWLAQELALFRLDDPRHALVAVDESTRPDGSARVVFEQITDGLTVDRAGLSVFLDPLGFVRKVIGNPVPDIAPSLSAVVTELDAVALARSAIGDAGAPLVAVELVYMDLQRLLAPADVALAWRVELGGDIPVGVWIDAETGAVLHVGRADASVALIEVRDGSTPLSPPVFSEAAGDSVFALPLECNIVLGPGNDPCDISVDASNLQRSNWFFAHARNGWSGGGAPAVNIFAGEDFITVFDDSTVPFEELEQWRTTPHEVHLTTGLPDFEHWDLLWHGFCHGFHQANLALPSFSTLTDEDAALNEHVADACALILDSLTASGTHPRKIETRNPALEVIRDHETEFCLDYSTPGFCDATEFSGNLFGCREFTHAGNYLHREVEPDGTIQEPPAHANSCVFTKPLSLLLESAPVVSFRGVDVHSVDPALVDLVYHKHFTAVGGPFFDLEAYRADLVDAAIQTDTLCRSGTNDTMFPCTEFDLTTRTIHENVAEALDAAGFWIPPRNVERLLTPPDSPLLFPAGSIGAVSIPPGGTEFLFFSTTSPPTPLPGGEAKLVVYEDADLLDTTPGVLVDVETSAAPGVAPALLQAGGMVDADVDPIVGLDFAVAWVGSSGEIHVLHGLFGTAVVDVIAGAVPRSVTAPQVSVAHTGSEVFLAWVDATTFEFVSAPLSNPSATLTIDPFPTTFDHTLAYDPALNVLHAFYAGPLIDATLFHRTLDLNAMPLAWSPVEQVEALLEGVDSVPGLATPDVNRLSRPVRVEGRPAAVVFDGVIQLLYRGRRDFGATSVMLVTHMTIDSLFGIPVVSREHYTESASTGGGLLRTPGELFGFWRSPAFSNALRFSRKGSR